MGAKFSSLLEEAGAEPDPQACKVSEKNNSETAMPRLEIFKFSSARKVNKAMAQAWAKVKNVRSKLVKIALTQRVFFPFVYGMDSGTGMKRLCYSLGRGHDPVALIKFPLGQPW